MNIEIIISNADGNKKLIIFSVLKGTSGLVQVNPPPLLLKVFLLFNALGV